MNHVDVDIMMVNLNIVIKLRGNEMRVLQRVWLVEHRPCVCLPDLEMDGGYIVTLIGLKLIRSKSYAVHTVESALACDITTIIIRSSPL